MRNKVIIAILALISVSCSVQTNTNEVNPTPSSSENINSTPEPEISKKPYPTPTPKPIFIERCMDFNEYKVDTKIHYPSDIVVAKDGSFIYVITTESVYINNPFASKERVEKNTIYYDKFPIKVIYKISENKQVSIVDKPNGKDFDLFNCSGHDIEKDTEGNLIISTLDKVLSFKDNRYTTLIENTKRKFTKSLPCLGYGCPTEYYDIMLGIFVENNTIYSAYTFTFEGATTYSEEFIESYNINNKDSLEVYRKTINETKNLEMYENFLKRANKINIFHPFYSIYNNKPFFGINNIINPIESSKVGYITRIRKDSKGNIFGLDFVKNVVWKIDVREQKVDLFAGSGKFGYKDGKGELAEFNGLSEFDIDDNDNLYLSDTSNHAIRKITPKGEVSTFYKELN
jgi:hypothetical protein